VDEQDPSPAGGTDEPVEHTPIEAGAATGDAVEPTAPIITAEAASRQAIAYRLLGAACALVGVLLVVGGLIALRGHGNGDNKPGAAPSTNHSTGAARPGSSASGAGTSAAPTTVPPTTVPPTTVPPSTPPAPPPSTSSRPAPPPHNNPPAVRSPLTVLNNTTESGLADQAARQFRGGGWTVVKVGNFTGKIPNTTVYYDPGNDAELAAARALQAQYPAIQRVLPRYDGLPDSVHGVIVVLTPDWR
jgi:LytR cell envelope-related transcriptional attenuator